MTETDSAIAAISHTIQLSIAPVFLLTALGTILGVLNARLVRIVDRVRILRARMEPIAPAERAPYESELLVLHRRRHFVNVALTSGVCAALSVCLLIALAFVGTIIDMNFARPVAVLFIVAMLGFVSALLCFLREVLLALSQLSISHY